ncbi:MAG: ribokinase, partial [bacterium]|nr:ribokinase [bacterium]
MKTAEILAGFKDLSVLVVGDICLDRWCSYDPAEADVSRETGIPRVGVVESATTPGAGGTVANNLAALGVGKVAVLGATGEDGFAWELRRALEARGIEPALLVATPGMQTFTYTKLLNAETGEEDLPRVDFINTSTIPPEVEAQVLERLRRQVESFDVVMVSDQAETDEGGVVTAPVRTLVAELAERFPEKVFWVDSRLRSERFRSVVVKPNKAEAEEACQRTIGRVDFPALREAVAAPVLLVTHGGEGVLVVEPAKETWVKTRAVEKPVDICGAGDSFSAGAAMTLRVTGSAIEAARVGNLVAAVTIMKKGTG